MLTAAQPRLSWLCVRNRKSCPAAGSTSFSEAQCCAGIQSSGLAVLSLAYTVCSICDPSAVLPGPPGPRAPCPAPATTSSEGWESTGASSSFTGAQSSLQLCRCFAKTRLLTPRQAPSPSWLHSFSSQALPHPFCPLSGGAVACLPYFHTGGPGTGW